jgi:4-aminobutyrate aminotransferase
MGALSLGASKAIHRDGFAPLVPGVTHVPYPYCYRCPFNCTYPACNFHCVRYIEQEVLGHLVPGHEVAAIIFEPIQGEGGYVVPPAGYFPRLKELADRYGMLLIADEVQTGVGRTGKMWAIEHFGIEPDIIASAKGLASGMPLGAMIGRAEVMTWPSGAHANTFGGNPISCAAALVTLDLLQEGLVANAAAQGAYLKQRLTEMMPAHPSMGDVRGVGLMVGAEFVLDKATRQPAPALRNAVVQAAFEARLLLLGCGSNTIRFVPGLNVTRDILDESLSLFDEVLNQVEQALL